MRKVTAAALMKPGTAALSDAMRKTGAMTHEMQCRSARAKMAGPAFTVSVHPADILMVAVALKACPAGHVLVIDGRGMLDAALWGELTSYSAQKKKLAGVVIDGAIRDAARIGRLDFPVFARAVVPNAGGAEYLGEMGGPVSCAGQVVNPGDWVVGDEDGVVVIPSAAALDVLAVADLIVAMEKKIERAVLRGEELADLVGSDEVVERKRKAVFLPQLRSASK